ncbi:MAG: recombination protein O N-terminal domain-containing protein [Patescibacteria group bacterium]|nr:recombination protein O N-terminal domain-containing protein [Patescibacteria group bacterium]MDE2015589.1 recombination protein O N-terminal domain-containing protein [Patescibacteria group bacterium]
MQEYLSDAVVLDKVQNGDMDSRFFMFTKKFGKLAAKAKSARKITSKLAGHLQPGNLVSARFIERNGLQVVDALKRNKLNIGLTELYFLNKLLHEAEPEQRLWHLLVSERFDWIEILRILGWDADETSCQNCNTGKPVAFDIGVQEFLCENCAIKTPADKLLYIVNGKG